MASITSSLGIGSGLELSSLLDGLKQSEQTRLEPLQRRVNSYETKLSAYGKLQAAADTLSSSLETLGKKSVYEGVKVTSENTAFAATASDGATAGAYSVEVDSLAAAQSLAADGQASTDEAIGQGGTITLSLGDSDGNVTSTVDVAVSSEDSSLAGIRDAVNAADIGINASIVNDGSDKPYRLVLSSEVSGTDSQISVQASDNASAGGTPLADLLNYDSAAGSGALNETVAAADASLNVNGIAITSSSNTVEDAIQGVTLNLTAKTSAPETLSVTRDVDSMKTAIEKFVGAYNNLQSVSSDLTSYNGEDEASGVLLGDSTTRTIQNRIRGALNTPVEGGEYASLAQIGVSLQRDGTMEIDDDKLDAALNNNLDEVSALVTGTETTEGAASLLTSALENVSGDNGLLAAATSGAERSIESTQKSMERMQESIDATVARYKEQFVQLDSIVSELNSTGSYLSQQFASLSQQTDQ